MDTQAKNSISASCGQGYNYRIRQVYMTLWRINTMFENVKKNNSFGCHFWIPDKQQL